jgi:hypothetical protein
MRVFAVAALVALITGSAVAQTQPTRQSAYATAPTMPSAFSTPALSPCQSSFRSSFNPASPCYSGTLYPSYSAVPTETVTPAKPKVPLAGADDLSEAEAQSLIKKKGYLNVAELQKDSRGIWRGRAMLRDGKPVEVILDLEGNIYSEPEQ